MLTIRYLGLWEAGRVVPAGRLQAQLTALAYHSLHLPRSLPLYQEERVGGTVWNSHFSLPMGLGPGVRDSLQGPLSAFKRPLTSGWGLSLPDLLNMRRLLILSVLLEAVFGTEIFVG